MKTAPTLHIAVSLSLTGSDHEAGCTCGWHRAKIIATELRSTL